MTPQLSLFLQGWYEKAELRQSGKGRIIDLSYEDFLGLFSKRQLDTLEKHMADGSIYGRQNRENKYALVLSWKSFALSQAGVMHPEAMQICARWKSEADCRMGKGDKHSAKSKAKISKARTGTTHKPETKAKISSSMQGVNVGRKDTPETTAKRGAGQRARWDRIRAEKAAQLGGQS